MDDRRMCLVRSGAIALRAVGDEHEVVVGQVDALGLSALRVFDATGRFAAARRTPRWSHSCHGTFAPASVMYLTMGGCGIILVMAVKRSADKSDNPSM